LRRKGKEKGGSPYLHLCAVYLHFFANGGGEEEGESKYVLFFEVPLTNSLPPKKGDEGKGGKERRKKA